MLWVLLGILAVIFTLLIVPIKLHVVKTDTTAVTLHYLCFKIKLLPQKPKTPKVKKSKKPKKKPIKKPKKQPEEKPKEKGKLDLQKTLQTISDLFSALLPIIRKLLKRITFSNIELLMAVAGKDAAKTADSFGKTYAAVTVGRQLFERIFTVKYKRVLITPDFLAEKTVLRYAFFVKFRLIYILSALLNIAFVLLKTLSKLKSQDPKSKRPKPNKHKTTPKTSTVKT